MSQSTCQTLAQIIPVLGLAVLLDRRYVVGMSRSSCGRWTIRVLAVIFYVAEGVALCGSFFNGLPSWLGILLLWAVIVQAGSLFALILLLTGRNPDEPDR